MKKFTFGDFTAEIDTADADFMERFETESVLAAEEQAKTERTGKRSEVIRKLCACTFAYFERLFGESASRLMFGDTVNLRNCDSALLALYEAVKEDQEQYNCEAKKRLALLTGKSGEGGGTKTSKRSRGKE